MNSKGQMCSNCNKKYINLSSLRRHVKKEHPTKLEELAPHYYKNKENFKFSCKICDRNFNKERYLRFHMKSHKEQVVVETSPIDKGKKKKDSKKCPVCLFGSSKTEDMLQHFSQLHSIDVSCKNIEFPSFLDFEQWLRVEEEKTQSKFVKKEYKKFQHHCTTIFMCHRSGMYIPEGKGVRSLKMKGSVKINGYCPANIKLVHQHTGTCLVQYIKTHVGHTSDTNLGYLYLTKEERSTLASQIASKIPFEDILDGVRNSISNMELKRIHLLRRKDLHNIESSFKLTSKSVRHSNDAISIESWVNQMKCENDCVIFYKPQDTVSETHSWLKQEDFVLMIMTSAQCDLLLKYGRDCICLDGTHGLNSYNFEMHTLLVLDDLREGFPCGFCISNRSDKEIFKLFFGCIREKTGIISPKVFMSDLAEGYFTAWKDVMGLPEKRLFCTWHLDRAWRHNLPKIKSKEKQIVIYKQLRSLLEERDCEAFYRMFNMFCKICSDDPQTTEFAKYFIDNYSKNYEYWAYSFRLHLGINTNMHLERMHETIKYIYLKGKKVKRLDKAVSEIMRFVRDKLIERLIVSNKGKLCSKIKDLRTRHKTSLSMDSNLIIPSDNGWECASEKGYEMYLIQELNKTCTCQLICSECNICIHRYYCSCVDSAIKFNMCKHIHLLATLRIQENSTNNKTRQNIDVEEPNTFIIDESKASHKWEEQRIIKAISNNKDKVVSEETIKIKKETLKTHILQVVDDLESMMEIEAAENFITPIQPTVMAIRMQANERVAFALKSTPSSSNKNITPQRRLYKTKKTRTKAESKKKLAKPDIKEVEELGAYLLNNNLSQNTSG